MKTEKETEMSLCEFRKLIASNISGMFAPAIFEAIEEQTKRDREFIRSFGK